MSDLQPCPKCGLQPTMRNHWECGSFISQYNSEFKQTTYCQWAAGQAHIRQLEEALRERDELLDRALAIIVNAIMHGMPVTQEVADVRNKICRIVQPPTKAEAEGE